MSEELGSHTLLVVLFRLVEETVYDDGHKELIPTYELHVCVCVCVCVCMCVCVYACGRNEGLPLRLALSPCDFKVESETLQGLTCL